MWQRTSGNTTGATFINYKACVHWRHRMFARLTTQVFVAYDNTELHYVGIGDRMRRIITASAVATVTLAACVDTTETQRLKEQVQSLRSDLDRAIRASASFEAQIEQLAREKVSLQATIDELSMTAPILLEGVSKYAAAGDLVNARTASEVLKKKFPQSQAAKDGQKIVDQLNLKIVQHEEEAKRLAALGFKALKATGLITTGSTKVVVGVPTVAATFVFDRYDDTYHYQNPDRGHRYIVASMKVTAAKDIHDPKLPGIALYSANGSNLRKLQDFDVRLARWEDYATYLGNYSDSRNDFAKNATVLFSIGAAIANEDLKKRPLYMVATTEGCVERSYARFNNPPVSYYGSCSDLAGTLTLDDFFGEAPKVTSLRRIN